MTKWNRISINLSDEEHDSLRMLASLRRESVAKFVRYLLDIHIKANASLIPVIEAIKASKSAKPI
jgi:hypothetical protein